VVLFVLITVFGLACSEFRILFTYLFLFAFFFGCVSGLSFGEMGFLWLHKTLLLLCCVCVRVLLGCVRVCISLSLFPLGKGISFQNLIDFGSPAGKGGLRLCRFFPQKKSLCGFVFRVLEHGDS
jgi:hypothetical protein